MVLVPLEKSSLHSGSGLALMKKGSQTIKVDRSVRMTSLSLGPMIIVYTSRMGSKLKELSLFLPAYNEEGVIAETIAKCDQVMKAVAEKYEILVVEDGSKDKTAEVVEGCLKKYPNLRMIQHKPNRGYGGALKTGFYETKYDPIVFIDSDGQFDFSEVTKLIDMKIKTGADLVIGYRIKRSDPPKRLFLASMLKIWNKIWFGFYLRDVDCAFKLISRRVMNGIPRLKSDGGIVSSELMAKVTKAGFRYCQVGVHHYPRTRGKSTGDNLNVITKAVTESWAIWRDLHSES